MSRRPVLTFVVAAGTMICAGMGAAPALAGAPRARVAEAAIHQVPGGARIGGALNRSRRLPLTITLQPRDPLALKAFATAVSTPGDRGYGDFLGVRAFARRFGAAPGAISRVRSALRDDGFRVGSLSANALTLKVSATTAQVERTFETSMAEVRLASGRRAYVNRTAATLPAGVADDVQGVVGLDSAARPQAELSPRGAGRSPAGAIAQGLSPLDVTGGPQPCSAATQLQADGGYTADQIANTYSFSPFYSAGNFGQGQTIALFEEGQPYPVTDVASYEACYTLGGATITPNVTLVPVDGGPGTYNPNTDDDGEVTLDIDVVAGMAPKANILVYSAPGTATAGVDTLTAIVSQDQAKTVSISYGLCEALSTPSVIQAENTLFQEAAAQGQTVLSASGDTGDASCSQQQAGNLSLSVGDPASQPFNTSVGGTYLAADGAPPTEYVWNDGQAANGDGGGSGGGLSQVWAMPSYQQTASPSLGVINGDSTGVAGVVSCGTTYCREVPDVAADASVNTGYIVYSNGAWTITGGTSAASPLWASLIALSDASATCRGLSIGFANPSLYGIASTSYLADFNDVGPTPNPLTVSASNDVDGVNNGLFPTTAGYDMTTGLGTPIAATLGNSLCARRAPVYSVSVANPGTQRVIIGQPVSLAMHAADSGNVPIGYSATGLPAGLSINPSTGVISGVPAALGTATVTLGAADDDANSGSTQFAIEVVKPEKPKASRVSLTGLITRTPKLTFTVRARQGTLQEIEVKLPRGLSLARRTRELTKGISLKDGRRSIRFKAKGKRRTLILDPKRATTKLVIVVRGPALSITRREAHRVRTRRVRSLRLEITAVNTLGGVDAQKLTVRRLH